MQIRHILQGKGREVVAIATDASICDAAKLLTEKRIGALVVKDGTGALTGGLTGTLLETTIRTPNSQSTALDIRPSMVTGLFTKTKVPADSSIATAVAGVRVRVLLDGKIVLPGTPAGARPETRTPARLPPGRTDDP